MPAILNVSLALKVFANKKYSYESDRKPVRQFLNHLAQVKIFVYACAFQDYVSPGPKVNLTSIKTFFYDTETIFLIYAVQKQIGMSQTEMFELMQKLHGKFPICDYVKICRFFNQIVTEPADVIRFFLEYFRDPVQLKSPGSTDFRCRNHMTDFIVQIYKRNHITNMSDAEAVLCKLAETVVHFEPLDDIMNRVYHSYDFFRIFVRMIEIWEKRGNAFNRDTYANKFLTGAFQTYAMTDYSLEEVLGLFDDIIISGFMPDDKFILRILFGDRKYPLDRIVNTCITIAKYQHSVISDIMAYEQMLLGFQHFVQSVGTKYQSRHVTMFADYIFASHADAGSCINGTRLYGVRYNPVVSDFITRITTYWADYNGLESSYRSVRVGSEYISLDQLIDICQQVISRYTF